MNFDYFNYKSNDKVKKGSIIFSQPLMNDKNFKRSIILICKHGRDFSIINIPYAFKLLMQELKTMNIQIRIITDANIDNILNLNKSVYDISNYDNFNALRNSILDSIGNNNMNEVDNMRKNKINNKNRDRNRNRT